MSPQQIAFLAEHVESPKWRAFWVAATGSVHSVQAVRVLPGGPGKPSPRPVALLGRPRGAEGPGVEVPLEEAGVEEFHVTATDEVKWPP